VIGISLYLSQAISVALYMIAFAEAFTPFSGWFEQTVGIGFDARFVSNPATIGLLALVLTKGAAMGVRALYVVVATLAVSLVLFFLGSPVDGFDTETVGLTSAIVDSDPFIVVFAIVFPAFTGMTAGVGLSGDLRDPKRSIPRGTLGATLVGIVVYVFIISKLAFSAPSDLLATDQLVMSRIALWGPMILIGLGAATLSSAIGSVLVAPRTLQALAADKTFPVDDVNRSLASGIGEVNEPRVATLVTGAIALLIVLLGNVDAVARLISMSSRTCRASCEYSL
jgi:amino acid transporter